MKTRILSLFAALVALCAIAPAQTLLTQTTLNGAVTSSTQSIINVTSGTNFSANNVMYVDREAMRIMSVSGAQISVLRGTLGTPATPHLTLAVVFTGSPSAFTTSTTPLSGGCTVASNYLPTINTAAGDFYYCLATAAGSASWRVNPYAGAIGSGPATAAVASAAGLITPSGPLFHITGTAAITGFNLPSGFNGGGFCIIPDGIFTTTTANNIALASTAVVSKMLCYGYDPNAAKPFFPSY